MRLDAKAALRALVRSPAFAAGAVLTLAIALGLVTTAVGLLHGALGSEGSGPRANSTILHLTERVDGRDVRMRWPYAAIEIVRERARSFSRIASYTTAAVNIAADDSGERVDIELASPEYLDIVGIALAQGRPLAPSINDRTPGPDEILISDALWRRMGGTADVLGRAVRLSRRPVTVVGVLPDGFRGLSGRADVIAPHSLAPVLTFADYFTSDQYFHNVIARLADGASIEQARSELAAIANGMAALVPPRSANAVARGADVALLSAAQVDAQTVRARTLIAIGAVFVLLIAAVNIGNLVVARVAARSREFAMRLAVGASRPRVVSTIAIEMAMVTAAGLAAALVMAVWARDAVTRMVPRAAATPSNDYAQFETFSGLRLDAPVVIAVSLLALLTMVVISVLACRPIFAGGLAHALKRGGNRGGSGPGRAQRALLIVQVAISLALLTSAGLLFRTVSALGDIDPGFDPRNVLAFSVAEDLPAQRPESGPLLVERVLDAVTRVPGVRDATVGQCTPYGARCARLQLRIEGTVAAGSPPVVGWHRVGPDHFAALGIPVLQGRGFSADDRRGRTPVVVINEEAARRYFADRSPLGARIRLPQVVDGDPDVAEIVGVVGNVVYWPLDEPPGPDVYQPALQFSYPWTTVMVRTVGEPLASLPAIRQAIRDVDPNLPLFDLTRIEDLASAGRADRRFMALLLAGCAGLGLLLAVVGVYALSASWMAARRHELALRVALGAEPRSLVTLVMRTAFIQTATGLFVGALIALGAGRLLSSMLFGVAPHDPATLFVAASAMLLISLAAAYWPARRALHVDPMHELNAD